MSFLRAMGRLVVALIIALTCALGAPAQAEPPPPQTQTLETPRFRIVHTPRATAAAKTLAEDIEKIRDEFQAVLGRDWPGVTTVRLGYDRPEFETLALSGRPPGWAVALAYPAQNVILIEAHSMMLPTAGTTLRHELSHVALGQLGQSWPRWFQEGLAMYITGERYSLSQYTALFRAVTQQRLFSFEHLSGEWPDTPGDVEIAYAQSVTFVGFLGHRYGPEGFARLLDGVQAGEPFETSFAKAFRTSVWLEELAWREDLPRRYSWWPIITGGSTLWLVVTLVALVAYLRRRNQKQAALVRMDEEEAEAALFETQAGPKASGFVPMSSDGSAPPEDDGQPPKLKPTLH